jgi:hypothetical protein
MWIEVLVNGEPRLINFDKVFQVFLAKSDGSALTLEFEGNDFLQIDGPYEEFHKLLLDTRKT